MTNYDYGEGFYRMEYENLVKAVRERDLKIVKLQKECECMREQVDDLNGFQNILQTFRQFFVLVSKPQPPQKKIS